jgi:hypothetical protein
MPRKQRFKPSRKPKPQPIETTEVQHIATPTADQPDRPRQPDDIERGQPARSQVDSSAVIEDAGSEM